MIGYECEKLHTTCYKLLHMIINKSLVGKQLLKHGRQEVNFAKNVNASKRNSIELPGLLQVSTLNLNIPSDIF